jgi:hypothetical protein
LQELDIGIVVVIVEVLLLQPLVVALNTSYYFYYIPLPLFQNSIRIRFCRVLKYVNDISTNNNIRLLIPQAIHLSDHLVRTSSRRMHQRPVKLYHCYTKYEQSRKEGVVLDGFVHVTKNVLEGRSAVVLNKTNLTVVDEVKVYIHTTVHKKIGFFHYIYKYV